MLAGSLARAVANLLALSRHVRDRFLNLKKSWKSRQLVADTSEPVRNLSASTC